MGTRWKWFLLFVVFTLAFDLGTKYWARHELATQPAQCAIPEDFKTGRCYGVSEPVVPGFWDWRLSFNKGAAFSMFAGAESGRWILTGVGLVAVVIMVWMLRQAGNHQRMLAIGLGLVAGGALGNLADRIYFGVVTDFVLWKYKSFEWPIFNVADVALVVGVGLLLIDSFRQAKLAAAEARAAKGSSART